VGKTILLLYLVKLSSRHVLWNIYFPYFDIRPRNGVIIWGGVRKHKGRLIADIKIYESFREKFKENRSPTATSMYVLCFIMEHDDLG